VTRLLGGNPAGTAALMTSWLLIEQPGPWPADALENVLTEAFPDGRMEQLRARGLRPLLIRTPGRHQRDQQASRTVFVASGVPGARWLERLTISDLSELAAVDGGGRRFFADVAARGHVISRPPSRGSLSGPLPATLACARSMGLEISRGHGL